MTPEDRIQRLEETIVRLQEDAQWLKDTGFWTDVAPNDNLVAGIERAIALYVSLFRELTRPVG